MKNCRNIVILDRTHGAPCLPAGRKRSASSLLATASDRGSLEIPDQDSIAKALDPVRNDRDIIVLGRKSGTTLVRSRGFTLIEMIVYIALTALIVSGAANVKWSIMKSNVSAQAHMEVSYHVRFAMNQIGHFIRNASSLEEGDSVFLINPGVLVVTSADSGQKVTIDTFTKQVTIGGAAVTIRKLRMKEGAGAYVDLTSDDVSVTNFYLEKVFRSGKIENINIQFAVENANPGGDSARNASMAIETSLSFRQ